MHPIIEMRGITKRFPGIIANQNVSFAVQKGEIHALLGENGAGKSTLMSILFGLYQADEGDILVKGKPVHIKTPNDANRYAIGMVHQHFKLVHNFTVLENIILGVESVRNGFLSMGEARKKVIDLSEKYNFKIDCNAVTSEITVGMQQRVEILKMLYRENDILIFDEPSSVLTPQEVEELIKIMRSLAREGKTIILITHKLQEILDVADRCTVLRKGKSVGTVDVKNIDKTQLSEMMVGRQVELQVKKTPKEPGDTVLEVKELVVTAKGRGKNLVDRVSFSVRRGEIVCVAGIDGNGQSELVYALTGLMPPTGGQILINDDDITRASVRYRNTHGISHIPEDRHKYGLVLPFQLEENLALKNYFTPQMQSRHLFRFDYRRSFAEKLIEKYDIRTARGITTVTASMSGGNQQKAIVARELELGNDLLIAVQPTRGMDVGAIEYIHRRIVEQRDAGKAVLMVSLELDEVMSVSDRILVMFEGFIVGEFLPQEISVQELGLYMAGAKREDLA